MSSRLLLLRSCIFSSLPSTSGVRAAKQLHVLFPVVRLFTPFELLASVCTLSREKLNLHVSLVIAARMAQRDTRDLERERERSREREKERGRKRNGPALGLCECAYLRPRSDPNGRHIH